jgi:MSHA biogenesis protein MshI
MLSFLNAKKLTPGFTGIDIGADGVGIARVVRHAGQTPIVTRCDFRPWEDDNRERALLRLANEFDLKRSRCTTVLSADDYALLLTEAPDVPAEELRLAIRWRIKDLIDFHLDDATVDVFDVASPRTLGKQREMYVVAARNSAIQQRVDLCDAAGIHLDVIDIPDLAQRNLASVLPEDTQGVVMLSFTSSRGLITVTRQGELYLSRRLEVGAATLRASDDRGAHFDQIVLEVQRSLDYYDSHFQQPPVAQLVLSPLTEEIPGLIEHLNQNLNIRATRMELGTALQFEGTASELSHEGVLMALAAALRHEERAL